MSEHPEEDRASPIAYVKRHPWITLSCIGCVLLCIALAIFLLPESWSIVRKLSAGIVGGLFCGVFITASWALGKWDGDPE